MKTIQTFARYFPDKCGGIQVNISELAPKLQAQGIEVRIAAAQSNLKENNYNYGGVEVYRYPVSPTPKAQPNHGEIIHGGFEDFATWLKEQKADLYHQHHWEPKCGLPHLRLAKQLGMATAVTIHYPIPICHRNTLLLHGQEICDGKIDVVRCSYCCDGLTKNLPASAVKLLSHLPLSVLSRIPLPAGAYTPTSVEGSIGALIRPFVVPAYITARQQSLLEMTKFADRIIAVCEWLYQVLLLNGVPREKLVVCRYGMFDSTQKPDPKLKQQGEPLKVVFLGRWDNLKGIDILVEAVKNIPAEIPIELFIHGIKQDELYRQKIITLIGSDRRIKVVPQIPREELPSVLANYDLMAVPSQWFETGPLVVLEAHALGIPVLGSNLGGIAELVKHDIDGLLVKYNDTEAWTEALARLATDPNLLNKLRQGIQPIRTITKQAVDVAAIYHGMINN